MTSLEDPSLPNANGSVRGDERELLLGLIFGAIQDHEIANAAEFSAKLALCAKMSAGDSEEYGRFVKRVLIREERILDVFPSPDCQQTLLQFLRVIRRSRNDDATLEWLAGKFIEPQEPDGVRAYLINVERVLANALMDGPPDCRKYGYDKRNCSGEWL